MTEKIAEVREELANVKVAFHGIITHLLDHPDHKVKSITADAIKMCSAKQRTPRVLTHIRNVAGEVVGIKDLYFGRWMPLVGDKAVEFGVKTGSSTGMNPMCKLGLSQWSKQQSKARNDSLAILEDLKNGSLELKDIPKREAEIEAEKNAVIETEMGFETKEELVEYLEDEGEELA